MTEPTKDATLGEKLLDSSPAGWDDSSRRLWTLWDIAMNVFGLCWFMDCFNNLLAQRSLLWNRMRNGEGANRLEDHEATVVQYQIKMFQTLFEAEHMDDCAGACEQVLQIMKASKIGLDVSAARAHIDGLIARFQFEFRKHAFLRVDKEMASFVDTHILLGRDVGVSFPSACADIKEAGNCLAVGCYTAAVFHLMRISEHGLRKVATKLKVRLTDKGKHQPFEFATWDKVITGCRNKITKTRTLPQGPKREQRLKMFSEAADHCEYMKDIWRNEASHARKQYSHHDAMGVLDRVKAFMVFLVNQEAK